MKFLTNIYDPKQPDAKMSIYPVGNETRVQAWEKQQNWLQDKIIGKPQPTEYYTLEELQAINMVGVYQKET